MLTLSTFPMIAFTLLHCIVPVKIFLEFYLEMFAIANRGKEREREHASDRNSDNCYLLIGMFYLVFYA